MCGAWTTFVARTTASAKWFLQSDAPFAVRSASMYVARRPRSASGSKRSSVSASSSIAPRIPYVSENFAKMASPFFKPSFPKASIITRRPSAGVSTSTVETGSAGRCSTASGAIDSTLKFTKSALPLAWCRARERSAAKCSGSSSSGKIFSAPDTCSRFPALFSARIFRL